MGIATYCSKYNLDFTGVEGLKAYIDSGFYPETGTVLLTNVKEVPAGTSIMLMGSEGTHEVPYKQTTRAMALLAQANLSRANPAFGMTGIKIIVPHVKSSLCPLKGRGRILFMPFFSCKQRVYCR